MKYIINLLKCIFNPLYMIITANEENKSFLKHIKKTEILLILISFLITLTIVFIYYYKEIFGI